MQDRVEKVSASLANSTLEIDQKQYLGALIQELHANFSIPDDHKERFELFPFSNELGFWKVIKNLQRVGIENKNKKGALLFGESNILSILPRLAEIVDFILLADIEPELHSLNKHMISCLEKSETIDEYLDHYRNQFPIDSIMFDKSKPITSQLNQYVDMLLGKQNSLLGEKRGESLKDYHFLKSKMKFDQCKQAFKKLTIVQIQLNLEDQHQCSLLARTLNKHDTSIILCNFTNIHDYVDKEKLSVTVPLLANQEQCLIMYAMDIKNLRTTISVGLSHYFRDCLNKDYQRTHAAEHITNAKALFFYKDKNTTEKKKLDKICYVGFYKEYGGLTHDDYIKQIINGTANINDYCNFLHAHENMAEAEAFILEKIKQQGHELTENLYWIFSVRGNKDNVNKLLRCRNDHGTWYHDPLDYDGDGKEFSLRVLKAVNDRRTTIISNDNSENKINNEVAQLFISLTK